MGIVDWYILEKEQPVKAILQKLHAIIMSCAPQMEARLTYNIPFYYYYGRLCYLNSKEIEVDLGFCRGALFAENPILGRTELKEVRIITHKNLYEIQVESLRSFIFEAMILNVMSKKKT